MGVLASKKATWAQIFRGGALYGHADSGIWDLGPDAYPEPMILGDIPSVEGRECVSTGHPASSSVFPSHEHLDKNRGKGISQAAVGAA